MKFSSYKPTHSLDRLNFWGSSFGYGHDVFANSSKNIQRKVTIYIVQIFVSRITFWQLWIKVVSQTHWETYFSNKDQKGRPLRGLFKYRAHYKALDKSTWDRAVCKATWLTHLHLELNQVVISCKCKRAKSLRNQSSYCSLLDTAASSSRIVAT